MPPDQKPIPEWLAGPASMLYGAAVEARLQLYRWKLLPVRTLANPVLSVGNLTAGGTGKTPLVERLGAFLAQAGHRVSILSRGYRRNTRGLLPVSRGNGVLATPDQCGDEPYLLARNLPECWVTVGEDRFAAGKLAESQLGRCVHLLDDGYQHLRLSRSVNILLLDATDPFGSGHLLPRGRLRESPSAMGRADLIVVTRADYPFDEAALVRRIKKAAPRAPLLFAHNQAQGLVEAQSGQLLPMREFFRKRVLAFAGIARPQLFYDLLAHYQVEVVSHTDFGDHHRYQQGEIEQLVSEARRSGAEALITTEKDEVNLQGLHTEGMPCYYLRIKAEFADPKHLELCLQDLL